MVGFVYWKMIGFVYWRMSGSTNPCLDLFNVGVAVKGDHIGPLSTEDILLHQLLDLAELRQIADPFKSEGSEEILGGAVKQRSPNPLGTSSDRYKILLHKVQQHLVAVDPADRFYFGLRDGLTVSDDRQCFQRGRGETPT